MKLGAKCRDVIRRPGRSGGKGSQRAAFTLLELLIVVVVALIITAMAFRVMGAMLTAGRVAGTKATIVKLNGLLSERQQGFRRYIDSLGQWVDKYAVDNGLFVKAQSDKELARVLAKKQLFKTYFPQRFADLGITGLNGDPSPNGTEGAEMLYYFITGAPIPKTNPPVELKIPGVDPIGLDNFQTTEFTDTDGDGRLEFVDAWGKPLRFYRWPTRLIRPNGFDPADPFKAANLPQTDDASLLMTSLPGAADLQRDPDDPLGLTTRSTWSYASSFEADYHTLATYHVPLIVSAGPDGLTGLIEPADSASLGHVAKASPRLPLTDPKYINNMTDNITNLNISGGGK